MSLEPERLEHPEEGIRRSWGYESKWVGTWLAPLAVGLGILIWGLLIYGLIGHRERQWEYGTVPYVPGESIYSSEYVRSTPRREPPQVTLPGAPAGGESGTR